MTGINQCTIHLDGHTRITSEVVSIAPSLNGEGCLIMELENKDCVMVSLNTVKGLVSTLPLIGELREMARLVKEE